MGEAGWFDDIGDPGSERYWDGAHWTDQVRKASGTDRRSTHAEQDGADSSAALRQQEWENGFPRHDLAIPRGDEPAMPETFDRAGFRAMEAARAYHRYGNTYVAVGACVVGIGYLAFAIWLGSVVVGVMGAVALIGTIAWAIAKMRERRFFSRVMHQDDGRAGPG